MPTDADILELLHNLAIRRDCALRDIREQRKELRELVALGQRCGLSLREMARAAGVSHEHVRQVVA